MKSPNSTSQQDAQGKKKSAGQAVKKEPKSTSAKESARSQDNRSQGSDVNGSSRLKTQGKYQRICQICVGRTELTGDLNMKLSL